MKRGFTLIEILIVIAILVLLTMVTIGAYSNARQKASLDIATDSLVATLQTLRDSSRSNRECIGIRFGKEKIPQKLTAPFGNPREGCAMSEIKTSFFPFAKDITVASIATDTKEIDAFDVLFIPPHGTLVTNPSGDTFEIMLRSKIGGSPEGAMRTVVINTETGRIERE